MIENWILKIKLKNLLLGGFIGLGLLIGVITTLPDNRLHLVFCNVGQGDAIFIRTPKGDDILIDGGPNDQVLDCLGRHMPFFDRDLEMVILTHPHADHLTGLVSVLDRYQVKQLVLENISMDNQIFRDFQKTVIDKQIPIYNPKTGDKLRIDSLEFDIFWPEKVIGNAEIWTQKYLTESNYKAVLGESTLSLNPNDLSLVILLKENNFTALLTGDSGKDVLSKIFNLNTDLSNYDINTLGLDVLKVPHHGSKTSLTTDLLDQLRPKTAVISVGKNIF